MGKFKRTTTRITICDVPLALRSKVLKREGDKVKFALYVRSLLNKECVYYVFEQHLSKRERRIKHEDKLRALFSLFCNAMRGVDYGRFVSYYNYEIVGPGSEADKEFAYYRKQYEKIRRLGFTADEINKALNQINKSDKLPRGLSFVCSYSL